MTLREAMHLCRQKLQTAGVPDYEYDASALLQQAAGMTLARILGNPDEELSSEVEKALLEMLQMREKRIPLQQILGETCFYGYMFHTRPGTLIPRDDTECLVEQALSLAPEKNARFLDLCCGSGCIGISFFLERKKRGYMDEGVLSDISPEAISLSKENAELLKADISIVTSDLFEGLSGERFDLILSNPPYIPKNVMEELMPEVRLYEPRLALTDEGDGLTFYRKIAEEAGAYLAPGGYLLLEIGFDQREDVETMLKDAGYSEVSCRRDYAGLDRVVIARGPW